MSFPPGADWSLHWPGLWVAALVVSHVLQFPIGFACGWQMATLTRRLAEAKKAVGR